MELIQIMEFLCNVWLQKKSRGCCTVKKILIFIVLEVIVILIAAGVIFYLKYGNESCVKKSSRRPKIDSPLTYSKLFSWSYEARGFNGSWISGKVWLYLYISRELTLQGTIMRKAEKKWVRNVKKTWNIIINVLPISMRSKILLCSELPPQ